MDSYRILNRQLLLMLYPTKHSKVFYNVAPNAPKSLRSFGAETSDRWRSPFYRLAWPRGSIFEEIYSMCNGCRGIDCSNIPGMLLEGMLKED
ncbi:hypothetical protein ElyMa_000815800 [Elysia marginata]|uniref:Uncharacterized protein n=1 Tax=Elysia marginata TaxID=1093978 RepID=A0AAV4GWT8_9GAST|nr:hypothetical protein ElyMa_000815800 [Elysia marginata]